MLNHIRSWLKGTNKMAGLEVKIKNDLTKEYRLVIVKNSKGKVSIENTHTFVNIEALKKYLQVETSLVLCISGKGVINRFTSNQQSENSILAGVNTNEIITQKYETGLGYYSSLIRKDSLAALLSEIHDLGFCVVSVSLGAYLTHHFLKITEGIARNRIEYDGNRLVVDQDGELIECSVDDSVVFSNVGLDGLFTNVSGESINAYATVSSYLFFKEAGLEYCNVCNVEELEQQKNKYTKTTLWKRQGMVVLAITLLVLLVNFAFFSNLSAANNINKIKLSAYLSQLKKLDSLEKYVAEKKGFLINGGFEGDFSISKFCDELAASVPADIQLKELSINPVDISASRKEKDVIYEQNKVFIKGVTKNISSLNQWLKVLEAETGIENLKMEEYHYDQILSSGYFVLKGNI